MRHLNRALCALTAAGLAAGFLAGCGSGSSSSSGAGSGTVTLKVEGWKGGGAEPANVAQVNAAFQAAHPNIKLEYSFVPPNDVYLQKLQSQLLAGNAADVIMTDPQKVQTWGKSGYLADLSGQSWTSGVPANLKPFVSQGGKVLAAPMELSPVGIYTNMDILAKAGITSAPTDFPAFLDDLAKLKAKGLPGYSLPDAQGYMAEFVMLMSAATTVYAQTPDWDQQFMAGKVTFPQSFQKPLEQIQTLGANGLVDLKNSVGTDEVTTGEPDFLAGKSAFYAGGSWQAAAIQKGGFKLAFIPWPGGEAGTAPSALVFPGTMWSVNAKTKVSDAAKEYLDFWAKPENLAPYVQAEAAISPFAGSGGGGTSPLLTTMASTFASGKFTLMPINTWLLNAPETQIRSALQGFLLGKNDAASTLQTFQKAAAPSS